MSVDIEHHGTDNAELYQSSGFHGKPQDGIECVVIDCNGNNIVIATNDYRFNIEIQKGETLVYSYDSSGILKAKLLFNASGELVLNDGTDYAIKYNELKTAFDQLKSDFNNLITAYNAHIHPVPGVLAGTVTVPSSVTVSTGTPSTADMSSSKVAKVRL